MTKFMTLENAVLKKSTRKTTFKNLVMGPESASDIALKEAMAFDNILFLGHDRVYGDVFKAWDDDDADCFNLYFGTKGDEFDQ